jgi:hypothetical protein
MFRFASTCVTFAQIYAQLMRDVTHKDHTQMNELAWPIAHMGETNSDALHCRYLLDNKSCRHVGSIRHPWTFGSVRAGISLDGWHVT